MSGIQAYVLVKVNKGEEGKVIECLRSIESVREAHSVFGEYDAVALVQTSSIDTLKETIRHKIRPIEGVVTTSTMVVVD